MTARAVKVGETLCEYLNRRAVRTAHGAELQERATLDHPWHIAQIVVGHPPTVHDRVRAFVYDGKVHV